MLELRLCELAGTVEHFVVVEGTLTFTGKPRKVEPLMYPNVTHLIVNDFPEASERNPWKREMWQRNAILRALTGFKDSDVVLVSDVDEIPAADLIPTALWTGDLIRYKQHLYHFDFNTRVTNDFGAQRGWHNTTACTLGYLKQKYPQGVRNALDATIIEGGWHLSWLGGERAMMEKVQSYSHRNDLLRHELPLKQAIIQEWGYEYETVWGAEHLPKCVQENPKHWEKYFRRLSYDAAQVFGDKWSQKEPEC